MQEAKVRNLVVLSLIMLLTACSSSSNSRATHTVGCNYETYSSTMKGWPVDKVKVLLNQCAVKSAHQKDWWNNILDYTTRLNRADVAEYIISKGADVNYDDGSVFTATPLNNAVFWKSTEVIKALIKNGADPMLRPSHENRTAFDYANSSEPEILVLLKNINPEELDAWHNAQTANNVAAYSTFLKNHPNSFYLEAAKKNLAAAQKMKLVNEANNAWHKAQTANSVHSYANFLKNYPNSLYVETARKKLAMAQARNAELEKQRRLQEFEAKLPPEVRRDKYMLTISKLLKEKKFVEAIPYFEKIELLPAKKDPSLDYYFGDALLHIGQPQKAMEKLYHYVNSQGSGAGHYADALTLINEAEAKIMAGK